MRIMLNRSKSGGISRVTNNQHKIMGILAYINYEERLIWKIIQRNYHLNITSIVKSSATLRIYS